MQAGEGPQNDHGHSRSQPQFSVHALFSKMQINLCFSPQLRTDWKLAWLAVSARKWQLCLQIVGVISFSPSRHLGKSTNTATHSRQQPLLSRSQAPALFDQPGRPADEILLAVPHGRLMGTVACVSVGTPGGACTNCFQLLQFLWIICFSSYLGVKSEGSSPATRCPWETRKQNKIVAALPWWHNSSFVGHV